MLSAPGSDSIKISELLWEAKSNNLPVCTMEEFGGAHCSRCRQLPQLHAHA